MPPQSINFGNETKSQVTEKGVIFRSELEITVRHGCCIYPSAFQAQACLWGVGGLKQRARSMELSAESYGQQKEQALLCLLTGCRNSFRIVAEDWRKPAFHFRNLHAFSRGVGFYLIFANGIHREVVRFLVGEVEPADRGRGKHREVFG